MLKLKENPKNKNPIYSKSKINNEPYTQIEKRKTICKNP